MYHVELTARVQRFLSKQEVKTRQRIETRLKRLEQDPVPSDAKHIGRQANQNVFRYRIGKFRVLYSLLESDAVVLIHKIDKRSKVYS